jgi:hypothetical protein
LPRRRLPIVQVLPLQASAATGTCYEGGRICSFIQSFCSYQEISVNFLKTIPLAALIAASSFAHAAADFTTIRWRQVNLDDNVPKLLVSFTLPFTVNRSSSLANSAVLDLEVLESKNNFNEVYINPPTTTCTDNDTDANQSASIGMLGEHDDIHMLGEWAANHIAFPSSLLQPIINQLMVCIRDEFGNVVLGGGSMDNISLRSVVLHYHTTP